MRQRPPTVPSNRLGALALRADKQGGQIVRNLFCTTILALALAASAFNSASAGTAYDGSWSLSVVTQSGDCAPSYYFQLQVINGVVHYQGPAKVQGHVSSGGAVSVSVSTESQHASGSGKLSGNSGRGRWSGRSATERCSGSWTAQRY